jgi:hypothetical protein
MGYNESIRKEWLERNKRTLTKTKKSGTRTKRNWRVIHLQSTRKNDIRQSVTGTKHCPVAIFVVRFIEMNNEVVHIASDVISIHTRLPPWHPFAGSRKPGSTDHTEYGKEYLKFQ